MTIQRRSFLKQGLVFGGVLAATGPFHSLAARTTLGAPCRRAKVTGHSS